MSNTFELERKRFLKNFAGYIEKKIVLYGIGRRTATLVAEDMGFKFVGLMDRDPANIGKIIYNLPILSLEMAELRADIIIINAPRTYWDIIYRRIADSKIPVFYTNGVRAEIKEEKNMADCPYWKESSGSFERRLREYEVISFDMFDTLVARKVTRPEDIYEIVGNRLKGLKGFEKLSNFPVIRNQAISRMGGVCYTFDELYQNIQVITGLSEELIEVVKQTELSIEKILLAPRNEMINICQKMIDEGKEVYIVSDMYFSSQVLAELLSQCGLKIEKKNIIVSCEKRLNKKEGGLWKYYSEYVVNGRKAIHVGDDKKSDVEQPIAVGVDAFHVMSEVEMLCSSSVRDVYGIITNINESLLVGMVITELFGNPFGLGQFNGKVCFSDKIQWGYCVWGAVIFTFIQWLIEKSRVKGINRLIFFARDGYLLQKDYDYYCELRRGWEFPKSDYLYVSRRTVYIADIVTRESFEEWVEFPYRGKFCDFLKDRFSVNVNSDDLHSNEEIHVPGDKEKAVRWMQPYMAQVSNVTNEERLNYLQYLETKRLENGFAVVDIGYNGNTQKKLSQILHKTLTGLYFYNDLSPENECCQKGEMIPCFQSTDDLAADQVCLFKYPLLIESLFTAPYGMIISVDEKGMMACAEAGHNQKYFGERILINKGIQKYIKDMVDLIGYIDIEKMVGEEIFVDKLFGILFENSTMDVELTKLFYWDDIIVQRRENGIFS